MSSRTRSASRPSNARRLVTAYDLVVDGSDNFPARYAVGQACAEVGRPHVWGAVLAFQAQVSVWWPPHGPCYRCVFPDAPTPGSVPSCADAGVVGALVGAVGSIQAMEAVKVLLGIGEPLVGRLLVHDALAGSWGQVPVRRDPACPTCCGMPLASGPARERGQPGRRHRARRRPSRPRSCGRMATPCWSSTSGRTEERAALPGPATVAVELETIALWRGHG
ncbi:MAG: ThiF family adenylyltransferase [Dermatophilaceae bacterium]